MNPVRWTYLSTIFLVLSSTFLACVVVLPAIKLPQNAVYAGPTSPYGAGTTALSGYYIPTVEAGSQVRVTLDRFKAGDVDISIFPSQVGAIAPNGETPVVVKTPLINTTFLFKANATEPYGVYIISRNRTGYTLIVRATYSPYYWLAAYNSVGVSLVFASAILLYYYRYTSKRWKSEQEAIRQAREGTNATVP